jgi:tetratricopeptide (TPR) repeat protein
MKKFDIIAIRLLRKALLLNNSYIPALVAMGEVMRARGRPDLAKTYYEKALKIDAEELSALKGLAQACIDSGAT